MEKLLYSAEEVAALLNCSVPHAYVIIRRANKELEKKGFITIRGKISRKYIMEKVYGGEALMKGGEPA